MVQINLHFNIHLQKHKLKTLFFMLKFYSIHNEIDIDKEINKIIEKQAKNSSIIRFSWNGDSEDENVIDILVNRLNFFIETGKLTAIHKKQIQEFFFENGSYEIKEFSFMSTEKKYQVETNTWTLGNYFVLKYHLLNEIIEKLSNTNEID